MMHKVGSMVRVVNPYSGGCFDVGDVVTITRIGDKEGFNQNCYGAISPHDGYLWYLNEDEVSALPLSNGDLVRSMNDVQLKAWYCNGRECSSCPFGKGVFCRLPEWLTQPAEVDVHEQH